MDGDGKDDDPDQAEAAKTKPRRERTGMRMGKRNGFRIFTFEVDAPYEKEHISVREKNIKAAVASLEKAMKVRGYEAASFRRLRVVRREVQ